MSTAAIIDHLIRKQTPRMGRAVSANQAWGRSGVHW